MRLVVGLGNPGISYINTRHNIGFSLLDYISKSKNIEFKNKKFNALYLETIINGEKVIFIKPLSYMNLSGSIVKKFVDYYKIPYDNILVIQDDLDMSFGRVKLVYNSSCGGHNGIRDIEDKLCSKEYVRLKIGISNDKSIDTKNYVLGRFSNEELLFLNDLFFSLKYVIDDFCKYDLNYLMNKYNKK